MPHLHQHCSPCGNLARHIFPHHSHSTYTKDTHTSPAPRAPRSLTHGLTHDFTTSRPHNLTTSQPHNLTTSRPHGPHNLTTSLPHSLTHDLTHDLTHSRPHSHDLTHDLTTSLTTSLITDDLTHDLTHDLIHDLTHDLTTSITQSLNRQMRVCKYPTHEHAVRTPPGGVLRCRCHRLRASVGVAGRASNPRRRVHRCQCYQRHVRHSAMLR